MQSPDLPVPTADACRPRRILFVDHTATLGGGELAMLNLVRHLDRRRFYPIVLLFSDGKLGARLSEEGVECHVLPLDPGVLHARKNALGVGSLVRVAAIFRVVAHAFRVARFVRRQGTELIHANSLKADVICGVAGMLSRRPVIWHVRDRIARDYLPAPVVWVFRLLARCLPTFVIANSEATLATLGPINPRRTAVVYSGLDMSELPADGATRPSPVAAAAPTPLKVGLVGRISRWKGQHVFIRAAHQVRQKFPDAQFQIIGSAMFGEDQYEAEVRALVKELGLEDAVTFTGFRADVGAAIADLDLLVHASTSGEPFGQVVVQGMAAGKAVVATNGGGIPEVVVDGVTGTLVPMGDHAAMAKAICELLGDDARRARMGRLGYERVIERFTIEATVARLERVYDTILDAPAPATPAHDENECSASDPPPHQNHSYSPTRP
jgi:glycosyltransferase involved in cell wall biosynthesis